MDEFDENHSIIASSMPLNHPSNSAVNIPIEISNLMSPKPKKLQKVDQKTKGKDKAYYISSSALRI